MSTLPDQYAKDVALLPEALRALLQAELAAGNTIIEVGHSHPAAPVGVYFKLANPISTRPRVSDATLTFRERGSSLYNGEFTDATGYCFILEAPLPPPPEPDMDAIREAANAPRPPAPLPTRDSAYERFVRGMVIDYDKWHDGIGYDLDPLNGASEEELTAIETLLLRQQPLTWREVEALLAVGTPTARAYLQRALSGRGTEAETRAAILRMAPELASDDTRTASIIDGLTSSDFYGGLSQTMDLVESHHPPAVVEELLRGVVRRSGEVATHFTAMLMFLHGKAESPFDWSQRPYFLKFNTEDQAERWAMFVDLCQRIGVDPDRYKVGRRNAT